MSKKVRERQQSIFTKNILTRNIYIPFNSIGSNIKLNIKQVLEEKLYKKCCQEGYIKDNSIKILSYSSGIVNDVNVKFDVMFECLICRPVEGQLIECVVKNITKAGIRAIYQNEEESPITIFIARDHHYNNEYFSSIKEKDVITTKVIGIRFELGDENISVLSELKIPTKKQQKVKISIIE